MTGQPTDLLANHECRYIKKYITIIYELGAAREENAVCRNQLPLNRYVMR